MPYFIENIVTHQWGYKSLEETENEIHNATSLIQYIGLTCGTQNYDSGTLHAEAKCILNSFLFLSENDVAKALAAHVEILEKLKQRLIIVKFSLCDVQLNILNGEAFAAILMISISNLLRRFIRNTSDESLLLRIIRCVLINLNGTITSPTCISLLNALYLLVKNSTDLSGCHQSVLNQIYLYLKGIHCKQAVKVSDEILGVVIKRMNIKEKITLFTKINQLAWWDKSECVMIIHLMKYWPITVDVEDYVNEMAPRLAAMLLENITDYAMKVLKVVINRMDFNIWNAVFIPNIVNMILIHFDNNWEMIAKTLAQCVNLGVQRFGAQVYQEIGSNMLLTCYPALVLHYSVFKGCLSIMDHQCDIHALVNSPNYISQTYGIKTLCVFNSKKSELTNWHIEQMKSYLDSTLFSSEDVFFKELHYFLSHMIVRANKMLQSNIFENLDCYTDFVRWLFEFSILGLLSRSLRGVKIGSELFNLLSNSIRNSSQSLKTKYNLDESDNYDQKQSPFYKHLLSKNAYLYDSDITYQVIVTEFLSSEKVFPEIFAIIEKWEGDSVSKITSETAFSMLESKHGKECITKAECCLTLALNRSADNKVGEILEKWKHLVRNFSSLTDLEETLAIYTFTSFISTLLQKGLITQSEYSSILACCDVLIRELVKVSFDHPHASKSIEQTFVTITNILCNVLKISNKKQLGVCFELANEIMEQGTGKSVACAAASAIHIICTNAFQSSHDEQTILNHYLESVLFSIYATPEIKLSKIRRNPEHRLIINAIVTAEMHPNRVFLNRSMRFILDVLENPSSGNSAKASALHSLEILISNSSIQNETFEYVSPAAIRAINEFSSGDWNVKNGAIQVLQALTNRLLGQKNNLTQRRRYGIDDLLLLYPDLMIHCYKQMYSPITQDTCDSVIAILALFSESFYTSYNIYNDQNISFIVKSFQKALIRLIRTNANVGVFAANAYAALYPLTNISIVMCDIVEWVKFNFDCISKNVFATVISLLVAFLNKFNAFFMSEESVGRVNCALLDLKNFLKVYNYKYELSLFNLLAVITYDVLELKDKITLILRRDETFETRLWLNTNLPFVLNNIGVEEYPSFMKRCFTFQLSNSLLKHCVESVVNRYSELKKFSLINTVLTCFITKFISLQTPNYILISFCEIILLLLEGSDCYACSRDVVLQLRRKSVTTLNIHSVSIYLAVLNYCCDYVEEDGLFLNNVLQVYTYQVANRDAELQVFIASTLIFLYNSIDISQRSDLLKISFILLLTPESATETCKFLASVFNQNLRNTYETLLSLLSVKNLLDSLKYIEEVPIFLNKLKQFVNTLGDEFEDCGMFYMKQNDHICSYKKSLLSILEKQIEIVAKMR
ncbi:hypothetical protein RN001_016190 [Aquatica leii]|uniref:DUF2428 domain-containing protein n=1 Tax=Aquatica leii TaxID=1421715 RepID=A0AAN7NZ23_9COLE|nr:hypothetical protein RN001_016190 [Aquatica leii]